MENMNGMMPNGMGGPPNVNSMQRPQPGNAMQQIHARIMESLRQGQSFFQGGWQATMDIRQRANMIMQLISALRVLEKDTYKCINIAETWEKRTITESPNQDFYKQAFQAKLNDVKRLREQQANKMMQPGQMGNGMPGLNDNMMNMQGNMNQMNFNNNPMAGMNQMPGVGGANLMPQNNNFNPQMPSGQMQPNQMQRSGSNFMNPQAMQNAGMQPNMLNMNQPNPQQQQNNPLTSNGQTAPNQLTPQQHQEAQRLARAQFESMPDTKKNEFRQRLYTNMPDQARQSLRGDPLMMMLVKQAQQRVKGSQQGPQGPQVNGNAMAMNNQGMPGNVNQVNQGSDNQSFAEIMSQHQNALRQQNSGELVVPASNNPNGMNLGAPGMNQQAMGNNPMLQNQMQQMRAQQERNRREQIAQQTKLAQQHANFAANRNQAQQQQQGAQLTGQPGGLNAGPAGQVNSPAMPNLNRPMVPPGGQTPATPQQNGPNGMSGTPNPDAGQMPRNMMNPNAQNNAQINMNAMMQNPTVQQLLRNVPPQARERLQTLPPGQMQEFLRRMQNQNNQNNQNNPNAGNMPGANFNMNNQGNNNMPNIPNQQDWSNNNNNMQPNMNGTGMNFNPHVNMGNQGPNPQLDQRQQQLQMHKSRAADTAPFPKPVLTRLNNMKVPAGVQTWGQLKMHCNQNSAVVGQNMVQQVAQLQEQWFKANPQLLNQAFQQYMQHQQQLRQNAANMPQSVPQGVQAQPMVPQSSHGGQVPPAPMGNAPVPTAPMVSPAPMGQPPNAAQGQPPGPQFGASMPPIQPPTPNDIQMFRAKFPQLAQASDEDVKKAVMQAKMKSMNDQRMRQQHQALRNAQLQQMGQMGPAQPPAGAGPQPAQRPRPTPQNGGIGMPPGSQIGQKRPADGDMNEMPNPNATLNGVPQAPNMQATPSQQRLQGPAGSGLPSQEQLNQMSVQEQTQWLQKAQQMKQVELIKRAQQGLPGSHQGLQNTAQQQIPASQSQQPPNPNAPANQLNLQLLKKLEELWQEASRNIPNRAPVQLDSQSYTFAETTLKQLYNPMKQVSSMFAIALRQKYFGEDRIKEMMRCQILVSRNFDSKGNVNKPLTIDLNELRNIQAIAKKFFTELKERQQQSQAGGQNGQQGPNGNAKPAAAKAGQGKQQQNGASAPAAKGAQNDRKASTTNKGGKAPSAPVDEKAPDVPWGVSSPHGRPNYGIKGNELTSDKLKIPPPKKRKGNNQVDSTASTPAGQAGTPGAVGASPSMPTGKVPSPEQVRKTPSQVKQEQVQAEVQQRLKFKCSDETCEHSLIGFETQEQLQKHTDAMHQSISDPLGFLLENAASALGVNHDGEFTTATKSDLNKGQVRKRISVQNKVIKREGQTPNTPAAVGTPATPGSSSRAAGKPSATPVSRKAASDSKATDPVGPTSEPTRERTLRESIADKMGLAPQSAPAGSTGSSAEAIIGIYSNDQAWQEAINATLTDEDSFEAFLTMQGPSSAAVFDDWGLRPDPPVLSPTTTPSDSSSSQSSHESDISFNERLVLNLQWDAFGNGDTMVPEMFKLQNLDLGLNVAGVNVAQANNAAGLKTGAEGKNDKDASTAIVMGDDGSEWTSQPDFGDWDAMFGPNAGLDVDSGMDWLHTASQ